jgi:hypothetical protein
MWKSGLISILMLAGACAAADQPRHARHASTAATRSWGFTEVPVAQASQPASRGFATVALAQPVSAGFTRVATAQPGELVLRGFAQVPAERAPVAHAAREPAPVATRR